MRERTKKLLESVWVGKANEKIYDHYLIKRKSINYVFYFVIETFEKE